MRRYALLTLAVVLAAPAFSQVEVVEPGGATTAPVYSAPAQTRRTQPQPAQAAASGSGELFYQLQLLQDEVMKLRGIVEEQGEELRQLKQQRLEDYISLDKRIGALGGGSAPPAADGASGGFGPGAPPIDASVAPTPSPAVPAAAAARSAATPQEEQAYQAAYEQVRARKFPEATTAFKSFVAQYPSGDYAGNAHYWLGELYLLDGDSASAKKHFETLLGQFGDNRRVPDAMFKLGRIYHQEGDAARAKDILDRVVNEYAGSDSTAPRLAREYLQQNF
ncbi:MAG: tol-pal system protein YbgF [Pseudomonadales bacterium]|jgi:tol-pal system protein YbgF|nr:tol-pal system protein YbgF [Pseudomonadales bacterium]